MWQPLAAARQAMANPVKSLTWERAMELSRRRFVILIIMKISKLCLLGLVGLAPGLALAANPAPENESAFAEVMFLEPKTFTDVSDHDMGDYVQTAYLDQLRDYLVRKAERYVPPGHKLSVTFTDIDMAGDFEPWRGPQFSDIRIVKDIYPPRMELSFRLVDADGNVVEQGKRTLRDLSFLMKLNTGFRDDPLRHEKALLEDWLRDEFNKVQK